MSTTVKVISCVLLTLRLKKSITQGTVPCVNQNQISFTALVIVSVANAVLLTICQLHDKINLGDEICQNKPESGAILKSITLCFEE